MSLWCFSSGFIIKDLNDFLMLLDACHLLLLNVTPQDGYGERPSIKHSKFQDKEVQGSGVAPERTAPPDLGIKKGLGKKNFKLKRG